MHVYTRCRLAHTAGRQCPSGEPEAGCSRCVYLYEMRRIWRGKDHASLTQSIWHACASWRVWGSLPRRAVALSATLARELRSWRACGVRQPTSSGALVSIVGPPEARPADGLAIDFVVESDRAQLSEIVRRGAGRTTADKHRQHRDPRRCRRRSQPDRATQGKDDHPLSVCVS
jgi:hypothetical protein